MYRSSILSHNTKNEQYSYTTGLTLKLVKPSQFTLSALLAGLCECPFLFSLFTSNLPVLLHAVTTC